MSLIGNYCYLDHAATTPVDPAVLREMSPFFTEHFGNASGSHSLARKAATELAKARRRVAVTLGCDPGEVIFTSGGTEANNLALKGVCLWAKRQGRGQHLIVSQVEHPSVLKAAAQLEGLHGVEVTRLAVDRHGLVSPVALDQAIRPDTALVSIQMANSEVGSIQPLQDLVKVAHHRQVPFHCDAVQGAMYLDLNLAKLGVDYLSLSAHKIYGPKGAGMLFVKKGRALLPLANGGPQENNLRAGTENLPAIIGLAKALEMAQSERETAGLAISQLSMEFTKALLSLKLGAQLTGSPVRTPGHCSFVFPGLLADQILMHLDMAGFYASSGSACASGNPEPSPVLLAMGYPPALARSAVRFTLGKKTYPENLRELLQQLPQIVALLQGKPA